MISLYVIRIILISLLLLFFACSNNDSNPVNNIKPQYKWSKIIGGSEKDVAVSIVQDSDDNYIITGITNSYGAGESDIYLVKLKSSGDTLWTRVFGSSGEDKCYSAILSNDNHIIITGNTSYNSESYESDILLMKISTSGDLIWFRNNHFSGIDVGYSVTQSTDGGYLIAGLSVIQDSSQNFHEDAILVKTDSYGYTIWTKNIGSPGYDYASDVITLNDGAYGILCFAPVKIDSTTTINQIILLKSSPYGKSFGQKHMVLENIILACLFYVPMKMIFLSWGNHFQDLMTL